MTSTSPLFSNLSIADAEMPAAARSRGTQFANNPLIEHMKASHAARTATSAGRWEGATKSIKLPAAEVAQFESYVRNAAQQLKLGSRIRYTTPGGKKLNLVRNVGGVMKDGGKRPTGGVTELHTVDGKKHNAEVVIYFAAAPAREVKSALAESSK